MELMNVLYEIKGTSVYMETSMKTYFCNISKWTIASCFRIHSIFCASLKEPYIDPIPYQESSPPLVCTENIWFRYNISCVIYDLCQYMQPSANNRYCGCINNTRIIWMITLTTCMWAGELRVPPLQIQLGKYRTAKMRFLSPYHRSDNLT